MKTILTLAQLNLKDYYRRKILIVTLMSMFIVAGTSLISNPFGLGVQTRLTRDLALTFIQWSCLLFAISLAATSLPNDIERKFIYPFMSCPISRGNYLWGKLLAIGYLLCLHSAALGFELFIIVKLTLGGTHFLIFGACFLIFLESLVIASLSIWLSTFMTAPVNFAATFLFYVIGNLSHVYVDVLTNQNVPAQWILPRLKSLLPYFEYFSIRSAVTHNHSVGIGYLGATTLYGILYIILFMLFAESCFLRKDL